MGIYDRMTMAAQRASRAAGILSAAVETRRITGAQLAQVRDMLLEANFQLSEADREIRGKR